MLSMYTRSGRRRRGSALLVTMGVIVLAGAAGAIMLTSTRQQVLAVRRTRDFLMAKITAEAGVNDAYQKVKSDFRALSVSGSLNNGTYSATVSITTNLTGRITSVGRCGLAEATVTATVRNYQTTGGTDAAFNYAILCGGVLDTSGSMTINNGGKVHSNGAFGMSGSGVITSPNVSSSTSMKFTGSSQINGNATAPSFSFTGTSKVTGTKTTASVPTVQIPTLSISNYYAIAQANGQVFSGRQSWSSGYTPRGGVVWVDGDISISGSSASTGCFICTGDFKMSGSGSLNQVSNYPAVISTVGNVNFTGSGVIEGLVYAPVGKIDLSGSTSFTGSLICGGKFNVTGSGGIVNYLYSGPTTVQDRVVITAWD